MWVSALEGSLKAFNFRGFVLLCGSGGVNVSSFMILGSGGFAVSGSQFLVVLRVQGFKIWGS